MYEPESDAARWGLNFLDVDQIFSSSYYGDSNHDVNISREWYVEDNNTETIHNNIENDEIIAHTLQEEFSRLSMQEASESSHADNEQIQELSVSAPDWVNQYSAGYEGVQVERDADELGPSSSCSSPESISYDRNDYNLEITDESVLDGEVGKRLNHLTVIPHVPRINGDIPSIDEATSDHQRLLDRLQVYELIERQIQGDGNCQFCALSDQFYRSPDYHKFVRQQVVNQLKSHRDTYEGYVPMDYDDYLKKIARTGEWGDHVTLQAAADSYGVKIFVVTSFKDTCSIEIIPKSQKTKRVVFLSFWAEVHYNSIYPQGDLPPSDFKRKRKWWPFGSKH